MTRVRFLRPFSGLALFALAVGSSAHAEPVGRPAKLGGAGGELGEVLLAQFRGVGRRWSEAADRITQLVELVQGFLLLCGWGWIRAAVQSAEASARAVTW